MIPINEHTVAAENETDLKDAVSSDNGIDYIYLANNITLTGGITIYPGKGTLVIDGEYPAGTVHTFTDMLSESAGNTIGVRSASGIQITIRNMIINGRNFYGVPYVIDNTTTSNVSITYEKVNYTGRQITFNRYGTTRYIDCDIENTDIGTWAANEVGEVCKLEIGGETTIRKYNQTNSAFWFCGNLGTNSFTILADAKVNIITSHYFMYVDNLAGAIPYTIEPGASFKLSTNTGISYTNDHRAASFLLDENASFEYTQTTNGIGASLAIRDTLTVKQGARFFMRTDHTGTNPLIRFPTGGTSQNLNIENPKSFVLYKRSTPAITFAATRPFSLSGGQVNYWQNAALFPTAGTFDDPPLYPWHNPDWSDFDIKGNSGSSGTSVTSSTLSPPAEPALTNLKLEEVRVLSVGELLLEIDPVIDNQRPVTGKTDPNANIRVEYTDGSSSYLLTGIADENGYFSIPTSTPIPLGTTVKVSANVPFLYITGTETVREAGELYIQEAPDRIEFVPPCLSPVMPILGRDSNKRILIIDQRVYGSQWELRVFIDEPMQSASGHTLPDSVVFVPASSAFDLMEPLSTTLPVRCRIGGPNVEETSVIWDDNMGILLHLTEPIHLGERYTANILWTVVPIE